MRGPLSTWKTGTRGNGTSAATSKKNSLRFLTNRSLAGKKYTPYEVYMKALYEYFRDDLFEAEPAATRSAVELAEFQEDAVKKPKKYLPLRRRHGCGLGWAGKDLDGKKILEDFAYHLRQKALVVCPASLRSMWNKELRGSAIAATVLSQEELGREDFDAAPWGDADVVLVDESHNFRNRNAQRFANLELILGANGGRGKDGSRKKMILLTATPINNDLLDLYQQLSLITRGDRGYFAGAGIGDLHRYFLQARRDARNGGAGVALFNLLEEIVIRRTRPFIRKAYPDATIRGKKISFPDENFGPSGTISRPRTRASTTRWSPGSKVSSLHHTTLKRSRRRTLKLTNSRPAASRPWWASSRAGT